MTTEYMQEQIDRVRAESVRVRCLAGAWEVRIRCLNGPTVSAKKDSISNAFEAALRLLADAGWDPQPVLDGA